MRSPAALKVAATERPRSRSVKKTGSGCRSLVEDCLVDLVVFQLVVRRDHLPLFARVKTFHDGGGTNSLADDEGPAKGDLWIDADDPWPAQATSRDDRKQPQRLPLNPAQMLIEHLFERDLAGAPEIDQLTEALDEQRARVGHQLAAQ